MYKGELFNSISHLIGSVFALVGLVVLVVFAAQQGDPWKVVSFSVYGASLVVLYTFSTLYHSLQGTAKKVFRKFDHISIYLLIAGSYTPFTLITLRGAWGWSIFGAIWSLAILGILLEVLPNSGRRILPIIIYLGMGWFVLIALKPLLRNLPIAGFHWLLTGGLLYSGGVIFYVFDKKVRHFHGIWHLFVLGGSVTHYFVILFHLV